MCGISGYLRGSNIKYLADIKAQLCAMTSALRHRGPAGAHDQLDPLVLGIALAAA